MEHGVSRFDTRKTRLAVENQALTDGMRRALVKTDMSRPRTTRHTTRTRSARLPVSRATNAYNLLTKVKAVILEEPERFDQRVWWMDRRHWAGAWSVRWPACGTVGCVAGWVVALTHGRPNTLRLMGGMEISAGNILGLTDVQAVELFLYGPPMDGLTVTQAQTEAYARAGAQHIEQFQNRHEAQLKGCPIRPATRRTRRRRPGRRRDARAGDAAGG